MDGSDTTKNAIVRNIIDYGSTYSVAGGDGAWTHTTARNLVPSDDEFTGWTLAANTIKIDRDKTGPFGTGKAWHWTGAEGASGGNPNTYLIYNFQSAGGNQLTDEVYYTFSVYVRNYNAVTTDIMVWDTDVDVGGSL